MPTLLIGASEVCPRNDAERGVFYSDRIEVLYKCLCRGIRACGENKQL